MERKEIETIEYLSPKEVAEQLNINPSTLRKYSNMITKEYGEEYFKRDVANYRLYLPSDLNLLKRIIKIKNAPGFTLEKAIEMALSEVGDLKVKANITETDTILKSDHLASMRPIQALESISSKQSGDIASLFSALQRFMKESTELVEKQRNEITVLSTLHQELINRQDRLLEDKQESTDLTNKLVESNHKLSNENKELINQNRQLIDTIQELLKDVQEVKEKDVPKRNWFSRLFSK